MSEWFALLIPVAAVIVLRWKFSRLMAWWEFLVPVAVAVVVIVLGKMLADSLTTLDTEYWGGWITHATYYEAWDEEVPCTHAVYRTETYSYSCGSKGETCMGSRQVFDHWEHPYDVSYHPEQWGAYGSNEGEVWSISRDTFEGFATKFKDRHFVNMHRNYHSVNGDAYVASWNGDWASLTPETTTHTYRNRVKVSRNTVYSYRTIDPKKSFVYGYPEPQGWECAPVLSQLPITGSFEITKVNAVLGASKKVRVWVLVFPGGIQQSFDQEAYWKGGNKNELVICIGANRVGVVSWARVFSWSKSEALKVEIRDWLLDHKTLDLAVFAPFLKTEVESKWVKRNWHDFDYLSVQPPTWAIALIWIITLASTVGTGYWCVSNGIDSSIMPEDALDPN